MIDATLTAVGGRSTLTGRCMNAAPLVVNGAAFVGCELPTGHDGMHKVTVEWGTPPPSPGEPQ